MPQKVNEVNVFDFDNTITKNHTFVDSSLSNSLVEVDHYRHGIEHAQHNIKNNIPITHNENELSTIATYHNNPDFIAGYMSVILNKKLIFRKKLTFPNEPNVAINVYEVEGMGRPFLISYIPKYDVEFTTALQSLPGKNTHIQLLRKTLFEEEQSSSQEVRVNFYDDSISNVNYAQELPHVNCFLVDSNDKANFSLINYQKTQQVDVLPADANLSIKTHDYQALKQYFEKKLTEQQLEASLIFFNDEKQCVYSNHAIKEFQALFPDFKIVPRDKISYLATMKYLNKTTVEKNALLSKKLNPIQKRGLNFDPIGMTEKQLIEGLLTNNQGMVVGEMYHEENSAKEFLIENMPLLKHQGVTTLYMEHLLYERHQTMLDAYMASPEGIMPRELALYLDYLDHERLLSGSLKFTAIVKAAKQHGIKVVAMDTDAIYCSLEPLSTKTRLHLLNATMCNRLEKNQDGNKFVVFAGGAHVSTYLGVPGISELLGCPNIVIQDFKDTSQKIIEKQAKIGEDNNMATVDILYHRSTNPCLKKLISIAQNATSAYLGKTRNQRSAIQGGYISWLRHSSIFGGQNKALVFANKLLQLTKQPNFLEEVYRLVIKEYACDTHSYASYLLDELNEVAKIEFRDTQKINDTKVHYTQSDIQKIFKKLADDNRLQFHSDNIRNIESEVSSPFSRKF